MYEIRTAAAPEDPVPGRRSPASSRRSAGPGRYDRAYEEQGIDYPLGYVRWTEQRNMAAFLRLLADGKLDVDSLIGAEYPIEEAKDAYDAIDKGALGVLLTYGEPPDPLTVPRRFIVQSSAESNRQVRREVDRLLSGRRFGVDIIVRKPQEVELNVQDKNPFYLYHLLRDGQVLYERAD